jgi:chemotaxis protein methyltransferase CheR
MSDTSQDDKGTIKLSPLLLSCLSTFIETRMGLYFPEERIRDLERGICSAADDFGFEDAELCVKWLLSCPLSHSRIETLASHLTVGETYFFRDPGSFDVVEAHILPELIRSRRGKEQRLKIWSAGCSTGEEAYSIAMALCKNIPDIKDWKITILATDINPHSLKKASGGVYGEWSFRNAPLWLKERFFRKTKAGYEILPHIKNMVSFSYHNLAEDPYPSLLNNTTAMDIIFCRNVLMYLTRERGQVIIQNLHPCLVEGGWLILGPVDSSAVTSTLFQSVNFPNAIMYKKAGAVRQVTEVPDRTIGHRQEIKIGGLETKDGKVTKKTVRIEPDKERIGEREPINLRVFSSVRKSVIPPASDLSLQARVFANEGRLTEALACCEKAISADKLKSSLHYLHSTILQETGRLEEAAAALKRVIYLDNNFVLAHFAMGHLMKRQGKVRESEKHFANACRLLNSCGQEDILPEADGMSAGRLLEIIKAMK